MKTLIVLLCCSVLVVTNCQDSSVVVIGSKFIRPKQPYTVAFDNQLNSNVKLKLHLDCGEESDFQKNATLLLNRQSGRSYSFNVPDIASTQCFFSAVNDGGTTEVNYEIDLHFPTKTLSIFILTDKPIYKPGDVIRFRVVVVDIALKPVKHIKSIEINIEDTLEQSRRQWTHAKLHNGMFESSYQLASVPALGMWTITVKANDNSIDNEKSHQFEVREYVLPKFVVKVAPSRTLLISDKEVSLNVTSHYTFGGPVRGKIHVELFKDGKLDKTAAHSEVRQFYSSGLFTFMLEDELVPTKGEDHVTVKAKVSVTEEFSNFTTTVSKDIPVFRHPYKVALIRPAMNYRPGAEFFCKISVKDHNGIPLRAWGKSITLKTNTSKEDVKAELNIQGMAPFVLSMPDGDKSVTISAVFENVKYDNIGVIEPSETTSTQYLQVYTKHRIIAGRTIAFTISSNEHFTQISYLITSRGSIVSIGRQKFSKRNIYQLKLKLSAEMAPHARLLVYTVKDDQLVLDFFELDFESFGNEFEFMLDGETYTPNQKVNVDFTAEKDSYVLFQAIDQGALLLGHEEFGLTKDHVLADLNEYVGGEDADNSMDLMESFGLFLRSGFQGLNFGSSRTRRSIQRAKRRTYKKPVFLRLDFPESWLWTNATMNNNPMNTMTDVVPDTFTSWQVTGFALSPSRGLGLMSAPRTFTVGKPFYMVANLPYSIKRGEVALIQITLFNFLGVSVTTSVTLFNKNEEIEFVDQTSTDPKHRHKTITVPNNQPQPISFLIKAKKLGEIAIKIEAVNELTSDGLERMLRVTPESRAYQKTEARFINLPSHGSLTFPIDCVIPLRADPGSTKIHVIIDPPIVASTAQRLDSLFTIPTGAANLNLLTFIPNVIVLDYLKETSTPTPEIQQKAIDYLSSGYQNQLKYKHPNGAFGQWSHHKESPSVFLTALVANSFITASKHIKIDHDVIVQAFSWIYGKQKPNGCFEEDGEVIYAPMQDNSSSFALTAFIVAAVKENENIATQFGALVENGVNCLASNFNSITKMHDIALATYALSLAKHAKREDSFNRLLQDSIADDSGRHWNEELKVEIAGYALLAYLAQDNYMDALPVMQWLNSQRYSTGRFAGVHSTFVALKALGKMATYITRTKNDYRVQINYMQNRKTYDTKELRPMEYIREELPDHIRKFEFKFDGIGFGFFQLTYQYNLNIQFGQPRFNLKIEALGSSNYTVQNLRVCLNYKPKEAYDVCGVAVVEVYFPSGLEVNEGVVRDLSNRIKKTERAHGNTAMFVYYSGLDVNDVCFEVTAHRKFKIAMHRPSYVVVYDTNDIESFAIQTYEGKVLQVCDICDDEDCKSMSC